MTTTSKGETPTATGETPTTTGETTTATGETTTTTGGTPTTTGETTTATGESESPAGEGEASPPPAVTKKVSPDVLAAAKGSSGTAARVPVLLRVERGAAGTVADAMARVGTVTSVGVYRVEGIVPAASMYELARTSGVRFVTDPERPTRRGTTSEGVETVNATATAVPGYSGENVTVAVVDKGFDASNPEIAANVVDTKDFGGDGFDVEEDRYAHGTAVAELVVDVAPNASLVLVSVDTVTDIYNAYRWAGRNDTVDVVSSSVGEPIGGDRIDGGGPGARAVESAVRNDTAVFIAAGNRGRPNRHWNGTWSDEDGDGYLDVGDSGGNLTVSGSGTVGVTVQWSDWPASDQDYDVAVYNESGAMVAESTNPQTGTQSPLETVYVSGTGSESYELVIEKTRANGTAHFDVWPTYGATVTPSTRVRTIGTAVASEKAIGVGAWHVDRRTLEPFSSRGPTSDGRIKPEVVAPDAVETSAHDGSGQSVFPGTSAAQPHAAGVGALVLAANHSLEPMELRAVMTETATQTRSPDPNVGTGYGLVNATAAVAAVERSTPSVRSVSLTDPGTNDSVVSGGETVLVTADATDPGTVQRVVANASWLVDGRVEMQRNATTGTYRTNVTVDGDHVSGGERYDVTVVARDPYGNVGTATGGTITVDESAPNLTQVTVTDVGDETAVVGPNDRLRLAVTAVDAVSGVDSVSVDTTALGGPERVELTDEDGDRVWTGTFQADAGGVASGNRSLPVDATDRGGNEASRIVTTALDATPPTVETVRFTSPGDGASVAPGDVVDVTVSANDRNGVRSVVVNASQWGAGTVPVRRNATSGRFEGSFRVGDTLPTTDSDREATVLAVDAENNTRTVVSDGPPVETTASENRTAISVDGPVTAATADALSVSVGAVPADAATVRVNVTDGSGATVAREVQATVPETNVSVDVSGLADGTLAIRATVAGGAGNRTEYRDDGHVATVTKETGPPTVTPELSVQNESTRNESVQAQSVRVWVNGTEPLNATSVVVALGGTANATLDDFRHHPSAGQRSTYATYQLRGDGRLTATVRRALDRRGNDGASGQRAALNPDAPALRTVEVVDAGNGSLRRDNGIVSPGERVDVSVTAAEDDGIGNATVTAPALDTTVRLEPDGDDVWRGSFVVPEGNVTEGLYPVTVEVTNRDGDGTTTATRDLELDATPSNATVEAVSLGTRYANASNQDAIPVTVHLRRPPRELGYVTVGVRTPAENDTWDPLAGPEFPVLRRVPAGANATVTVTVNVTSAPDGPLRLYAGFEDANGQRTRGRDGVATRRLRKDVRSPSVERFGVGAVDYEQKRLRVDVVTTGSATAADVDVVDGPATLADTERTSEGGTTTIRQYYWFVPGRTYAFALRSVRDRAGNRADVEQRVENVTLEAPNDSDAESETPTPETGTETPTATATPAATATPSRTTTPESPQPTPVVEATEDGVSASVQGLPANEPVTIPVTEPDETDGPAAVSDLTIETSQRTSLQLQVENHPSAPTPDTLQEATEVEPISYAVVQHRTDDDTFRSVGFNVTVSRDTIADRGVDPDDVVLYRYHDAEWRPYPTTVVNRTEQAYVLHTATPGLSAFAIAIRDRSKPLDVEATLPYTTPQAGESFPVRFTVRNPRSTAVSRFVPVIVAKRLVTTTSVSVPADGSRTVTMNLTAPPGEGTYDVRVGEVAAGRISVRPAEGIATRSAALTAEPPKTTAVDDQRYASGLAWSTAGATVVLLAVVAGAVLVRRRWLT